MPVTPSGSLIQALSNLVQQPGKTGQTGQAGPGAQAGPAAQSSAAKPAKATVGTFQQHIEGVARKPLGHGHDTGARQHAANSAPPAPPPGRGSIINLLV